MLSSSQRLMKISSSVSNILSSNLSAQQNKCNKVFSWFNFLFRTKFH